MNDYDYWISIIFGFYYFLFALGIFRILIWACDRIDVDDIDNDHHHVTITINQLDGGINPSIPVVEFDSHSVEDPVECVVCLIELVHGDKAKLLPTCNHWFHAHCIDAWLRLHSTCPICRKRVGSVQNLDPRTELFRSSSANVAQDACLSSTTSGGEQRVDVRPIYST